MRRRPPYFGRQAVAEITKRFNGGGEQQRLAQRHHLRPEALLPGLRQEGLRVRRDHYAGDDLDALLLEGGDLRREIVVHVLEAARIEQRETFLRQRSRESPFLVAPGVAVTVVREQAADFLVGRHRLPAREEIGNHVLESPEEVIGPVEPRGRIAFAAEEPRLPRRHGGNAGISFSSQASDTGLVVSGVDDTSIRSTLSFSMRSFATSPARFGLDWLSFWMICTATFLPPRSTPPANNLFICSMMNLSASPNGASGPVCGDTKPSLMVFACANTADGMPSAAAPATAPPACISARRRWNRLLCMTAPPLVMLVMV